MRILVTGASGFVGRHLVASLRRDGKSVATLVRGDAATREPDAIAGPLDLAELDTGPDWPEGIEAVVHLAALNPSRHQAATETALSRANVAGTAALARRARREGVDRVVFLSTANVHGPGPALVRETDLLAPQSAYARSKAEAEAAFWRELEGSGTQGCVLRPAPVYGRGGRGTIAALGRLARLPLPLPLGGLGGARSLLSIDGLVSAIALCLSSEGAAGETFLVADETAVTPEEIVGALRRGWKRRPGTFSLPAPLRRIAETRLGPHGPLAAFRIDPSHLAERTGWRPETSTGNRLAAMAAAGDV